ncbi:hypothetical protein DLD99_15175 [Pseudomonas kribbensis]|uniref:Uncharacterized protein n=1 Tax=Pseudomonas kribbensis TaxID=1628086 RepID=A0A345RR42_9PSED|nr:hypothetical protein [Pseudomonas kribbensis]AXI61758.1 hypothetical protein DLD99_15175 [Pseudomonas kribbensis]
MTISKGKSSNRLLADRPTVDDVPDSDPDGNVPAKVLINGGTARVPRWPNYADQLGKSDELTVYWVQGGITTTIYKQVKDGPITEVEFEIPLDVSLFSNDGVAMLYYSVRAVKPFPGNKTESEEKKLTIDRSIIPLPVLLPPKFPDADIWGYLHCDTIRPIWDGIFVLIPFQGFKKGDICESVWKGYSVLSADEEHYVDGTRGDFSYTLTEEDEKSIEGFELPPIPFVPHSRPLIDKCSGSVVYKIKRGAEYIGESKLGYVKIDRLKPGKFGVLVICGPP